MDTGSSTQEAYAQSSGEQQGQSAQEDCSIISPTLADILSDDRILRFYQCVKDIKTQNSPKQTASMFFALCHALGDTVSFLKVPNMSKIMFRQEQQIFAVNVSGTQQDTVPMFDNANAPTQQPAVQMNMAGNTADLMQQIDSSQSSNNLFSAAADNSPQHLLQAALASVASHVENASLAATPTTTSVNPSKRRYKNDDGSVKRTKKASPRDKEYTVRRNEIIQDLLKVSEADLMHQANTVDHDTKLVIQGHEKATEIGSLSPLDRFSAFANLGAHYDCDYAPKNAGVYYNFEYFQLYLAYRDFEAERQQQQLDNSDPRPVLMQVRTEIEKVLVNTNWEAIRRRLTIGERICQVCGVVGRGFLLLSKQVSGRKLLHNFNTGEWGEFMREFSRAENQPLLQTLQAKYSPERFYGDGRQQNVLMLNMANHVDLTRNMELAKIAETTPLSTSTPNASTPLTTDNNTGAPEVKPQPAEDDDEHSVAAVAAAVAAVVGNSPQSTDVPENN